MIVDIIRIKVSNTPCCDVDWKAYIDTTDIAYAIDCKELDATKLTFKSISHEIWIKGSIEDLFEEE